ncbi:MAG: two-component regulator propeller domain-containing protein, partial [Ignavibacteriaceae bacterium]
MCGEKIIQYLIRQSWLICLIEIIFFSFISFPQDFDNSFSTPVFEHISIEDGLPENSVTCILQDYLGYLWLGTQNGLVKYDGYSMQVFQPGKNDSSISSGGIASIFEDKNKTLWIGTWNGLNKFNRINESFKCYKFNLNNKDKWKNNSLKCIYEDKKGRFWVGTVDGLNLFDRETETFTHFYFNCSDSGLQNESLIGQNNLPVNTIIEDPASENLLIGTDTDGLWNFSVKQKIFSKYKFNSQNDVDGKIDWFQSF